MKQLQSHRDPPGCSLCVRLSSRLRLFITMETLSGAFNGGKEVSSLAFLTHTHTHTHTHRLFSGAIIISERTAGMTLPTLHRESISSCCFTISRFLVSPAPTSNHHWQSESLSSPFSSSFFSLLAHTEPCVRKGRPFRNNTPASQYSFYRAN